MDQFEIITDFLEDPVLRASFNRLAIATFGLDFEPWYQKGFFCGRYHPHACLYRGEIVANISANWFDLVIDGQPRQAVQLGTVMTAKEYRGRGLARMLMEQVIRHYEPMTDLIYLFANDSVLSFYPKFGFEPRDEMIYELDLAGLALRPLECRELDVSDEDDFARLNRMMDGRVPVSNRLGVVNDRWPLAATLLENRDDSIKRCYLPEADILLLASRADGVLRIYEIVSRRPFDLDDVLEGFVRPEDRRVELHFLPELRRLRAEPRRRVEEDSTLFVRPNFRLPDQLMFPIPSHT